MTLQQTIEIPADRRVYFDFALPESFGNSMAAIKLSIKPVKKAMFTTLLGNLYGSLKDSPNFGGDGMDVQRKIRDDAW
jgi:hypothetical protein